MQMNKRSIHFVLLAAACVFPASLTATELVAGFHDPANEARPHAYWNWLNGHVSLPDQTRDLEEAKAKGMGGLEMRYCEAMPPRK